MNTGVPQGKLYMEEYNPEWEVNGKQVVDLLKPIIVKAVDIRHVGSTAVKGMLAKPLIDIAVGMRELEDIMEYVDELEKRDIHYWGEVVPGQREFSIDDPKTGNRLVHIHVVTYEGPSWVRYRDITDYLNADEKVRRSYILLKKALLLRYEDRPEKYGPAKTVYLDDLEEDAILWRKQQQ